MSIIRDDISSNNMELTDFKRHSTGISQQMQVQLTELREKLTFAFGEITTLVTFKTQSDQEMMQGITSLQQSLSGKTTDLESLKRSYAQEHSQLQSMLIQIQNHLSLTNSEVQSARHACERAQHDSEQKFVEVEDNLRTLEEQLYVGNAESRDQMLQLQEEIQRLHESLSSVSAEFVDHKRTTNSFHNKLQAQVWSIEEGRKKRHQPQPQQQQQLRSVEESSDAPWSLPQRPERHHAHESSPYQNDVTPPSQVASCLSSMTPPHSAHSTTTLPLVTETHGAPDVGKDVRSTHLPFAGSPASKGDGHPSYKDSKTHSSACAASSAGSAAMGVPSRSPAVPSRQSAPSYVLHPATSLTTVASQPVSSPTIAPAAVSTGAVATTVHLPQARTFVSPGTPHLQGISISPSATARSPSPSTRHTVLLPGPTQMLPRRQ